MRKVISFFIMSVSILLPYSSLAQQARILSVSSLNIPSGDYSGITRIEGTDSYAIVSDKADGFFVVRIPISLSGKVGQIVRSRLLNGSIFEDEITPPADKWSINKAEEIEKGKIELKGDSVIFNQWTSYRDCEGIAYKPSTKSFFISGESDQLILEYDSIGTITGRHLEIPALFSHSNIHSNYGFEALCYNSKTDCFYTTTENQLPVDGPVIGIGSMQGARLRIQSFSAKNLIPKDCYAYITDVPTATSSAQQYAFGVPELCALPSGDLLVLEREFWVGNSLSVLGSFVHNKLYRVLLENAKDISNYDSISTLDRSMFLSKKLLLSWETTLSKGDIANYEGMCLGPMLGDGRQTLLLINDSQHAYKGILGEYLMIITLPKNIK